MAKDRRPTIWVTARRHGRWWSRLKVVYPQWVIDRADRPAYDVALARQLLALTGEFPGSKRGLLVVLAEYRQSLHSLAQQLDAHEHAEQYRQLLAASMALGNAADPPHN